MPRPILATIHPRAIRHNLERVRRSAPDVKLMSMVKANAYGHGLEHAFPGLRATDGFAVLEISEAQRLRALDWRGPILLIEGAFEPRDLEMCSRLGLWHTVHCEAQIDWLAAHKTQVPHRVFLKMNSGMNRLGFTPQRFRSAYARLNALTQVEEISLITHFSDADGPAAPPTSRPFLPKPRTICRVSARCATAPLLCCRAATRRSAATGCAPALCCLAARPITPRTARKTGICSPA